MLIPLSHVVRIALQHAQSICVCACMCVCARLCIQAGLPAHSRITEKELVHACVCVFSIKHGCAFFIAKHVCECVHVCTCVFFATAKEVLYGFVTFAVCWYLMNAVCMCICARIYIICGCSMYLHACKHPYAPVEIILACLSKQSYTVETCLSSLQARTKNSTQNFLSLSQSKHTHTRAHSHKHV